MQLSSAAEVGALSLDAEGLYSHVTIVKTIGRGPDVTEICVNTPLSNITLLMCKIGAERNAERLLLYEPMEGFEHRCDSRFSLKTESQTVFLHLMNLTAEDSGKHTCECVNRCGRCFRGCSIFTQIPIPGILIGAAVFIIRTAVTILCEYIKVSVQGQPHLDHLCVRIPAIWMEMTLMTPTQPSNSQTKKPGRETGALENQKKPGRETGALENQKKPGRETDASCKLDANM
ncbi:hypothetical protein KUCAC02_001215 [Chaenocephalus aceratus]|uniref:Uncharacterized protein n=1 Tax=Chaenocephalus aceratus TaxID=36190 RepID=A0ACB9XWX8_CHAAC|nr:hypothetical protein KUCAC02_001215 [Chaenocephalus aceratus]